MDEFYEIEEQRKRQVNEMIKNVIKEREESNKVIEKEFKDMSITNNNNSGNPIDNSGNLTNNNANLIENQSLIDNNANLTNNNANLTNNSGNTINNNSLIDNNNSPIISETDLNFNIKLTEHYKKNCISLQEYILIEKQIQIEKNTITKKDILDLKREVNKRLNQLNSDYSKIVTLSKFLEKYCKSYIFIEIFTLKILEQSTIQVSRYHESYKQYALFFKLLFSKELFIFYKFNLLNKKGSNLEGLYSVFFGILKECNLIDEIWAFAAGFLNIENTEFVVLEMYLKILGEYLLHTFGEYSKKIFRYIKKYTVNNITSPSQKYKIEKLIDDLLTYKI